MKKGRIIASALALALTVTSVCVQTGEADAAKKVSLKKTANVTVGKTVNLKLKNGSKKAKVTWKSSKSKTAQVTKKTTKGNAATKIKGIKEGKAKITATYKLGKKKAKKYKCTVTVKGNTPNPSATPNPSGPVTSNTPAPTGQTTDGPQPTPTPTPTIKPTPTPTATPTKKPTPSPDAQIYKTYMDIEVDGAIDQAWDFADKLPISNWTPDAEGKEPQTSDAYAKILWTKDNVFIMVEATDPEIDCGNEASYYQDSIELFVDEYNNKEEWGSEKAKNEFQFRTILKDNLGADEKRGALTDKTQWDGEDIKTAFQKTEKGYVVEYAIPLHEAPVEKGYIGLELQINDAKGGQRNGTWNLFANPANGDKTPYDSTLVFGECQYAIKRKPKDIILNFADPGSTNMELPDQFSEKDEDGNIPYYDEAGNVVCIKSVDPDTSEVTYKDASGNVIDKPVGNKKPTEEYATMNSEARYDSENKLVYCKTANNIVIYFPQDEDMDIKVLNGENVKITIEGTYTVDEGAEVSDSDTIFRTWLVDSNNRQRTGDGPITTSDQIRFEYSEIKSENGEFKCECDLEAGTIVDNKGDGYESKGDCDGLMIKAASWNGMLGDLVIKNVVLRIYEEDIPDYPDATPTPPAATDEPDNPNPASDIDVELSENTLFNGTDYWHVKPDAVTYNEEDGSISCAMPLSSGNMGIGFHFNTDKTALDLTGYKEAVVTFVSSENAEYSAKVTKSENIIGDDADVLKAQGFKCEADKETVVKLDLSSCTDSGYGIWFQHIGWAANAPENPTITIKSVKLVAK